MIHRKTVVTPGYDCRFGCEHTPKGDHGVACDEWYYIVIDGDRHIALEMVLFTPNYPASAQHISERTFSPRVIVWHYAHPTSQDEVLSKPTPDCVLIGKCYSGNGNTFYERAFFERAFVVPADPRDTTQPESFWQAMEAECAAKATELEAARLADGDLKWKVCPCCQGNKVVRV